MTQVASELDRGVGAAKKATVKVTAVRLPSAPWASFSMRAHYPDKGGKQDGHKLKFDKKAGPFVLTFQLDDQTGGLGLAFYPDFDDAMWVAVGDDCPRAAGDGDGAISPVSVSDRELVVNNANLIDQTLTFALRFSGVASNPAGCPPYVYDPQIINGGGSTVVEQ